MQKDYMVAEVSSRKTSGFEPFEPPRQRKISSLLVDLSARGECREDYTP
jgi:hypothetical protein